MADIEEAAFDRLKHATQLGDGTAKRLGPFDGVITAGRRELRRDSVKKGALMTPIIGSTGGAPEPIVSLNVSALATDAAHIMPPATVAVSSRANTDCFIAFSLQNFCGMSVRILRLAKSQIRKIYDISYLITYQV